MHWLGQPTCSLQSSMKRHMFNSVRSIYIRSGPGRFYRRTEMATRWKRQCTGIRLEKHREEMSTPRNYSNHTMGFVYNPANSLFLERGTIFGCRSAFRSHLFQRMLFTSKYLALYTVVIPTCLVQTEKVRPSVSIGHDWGICC